MNHNTDNDNSSNNNIISIAPQIEKTHNNQSVSKSFSLITCMESCWLSLNGIKSWSCLESLWNAYILPSVIKHVEERSYSWHHPQATRKHLDTQESQGQCKADMCCKFIRQERKLRQKWAVHCNHTANPQHSDLHVLQHKPLQHKYHSSSTAAFSSKSKRSKAKDSLSDIPFHL